MSKVFAMWMYIMIGIGAGFQAHVMGIKAGFFFYVGIVTCWPLLIGTALVKFMGV